MSALPTGIGPFVPAKTYQRNDPSTAGTVFASTVLSFITVSVLLILFGLRGAE